MSNCRLQDARDVLPKRLLAKLQKYCTGLVYVPAPTSVDSSRKTILRLHKAGRSTAYISATTGVSARWVRHIVAVLDSGQIPRRVPKFCQAVPMDLVRQIQEHVTGRLYVPPKQPKKARRDQRVDRLFEQGASVAEVARRAKLSERQVYRLKKEWLLKERDNTNMMAKADRQKTGSRRSAGRVCPGCGRPVLEPGATRCDICKNIIGDTDGNVIVLSHMPIAFLDRNF